MEKTPDLEEALSLHKKGDLTDAKVIYNQIIKLTPNNHRILYLIGLAEYQEKNFQESLKMIQRAISISPNTGEYYKDLGNCFKNLKIFDKAIENFQKAIKIKPEFSEAYYDLGILYLHKNEVNAAVTNFNEAIRCNPLFVNSYINLAIAQERLGNFVEAIECNQKALAIQPNNPLVYNNLGILYKEIRNHRKAIECLEKTIELCPGWVEPYIFLSEVYYQKGKYETSINWIDKALKKNKQNALLYSNRGLCFLEKGEDKEAIPAFKKAIELNPNLATAYVGLIKSMLNSCSWAELKEYGKKLDLISLDAIKKEQKIFETPFLNVIRHSDAALNYKIAGAYTKTSISNQHRFSSFRLPGTEKRIHIAYLSNNFRNHPTSNLLLDIFKLHNRQEFKVSCYSYGPKDKSYQRQTIKEHCDEFTDIFSLGDYDAANKIYKDRVDILVDLACYLKDSRIEIAAFHPAPIQLRWLGLAGTSGANFYDYLISDSVVTPEIESDYYSENLIYMPDCYQINSNQSFTIKKSQRKDWGLPEDHFIYCSFNAAYKIDPEIYTCWLNILKKVPKSSLWLMVENRCAEDNLRRIALNSGIETDRIIFSQRTSRSLHLDRLTCADLALDTFKVNGAATTSDALWAKVPVLTVKGKHFASRMSASILKTVGIPELVVDSLQEYQEEAIKFALQSGYLTNIKNKMTANNKFTQFFDTKRRVRSLEKAFKIVWEAYKN